MLPGCRRRTLRFRLTVEYIEPPITNVSQAPSFRELFGRGAFGQRPLISARDLQKAAGARGLDLPWPRHLEILESFDRDGCFQPVGFRQTNYTAETTWLNPDPDQVEWREEHDFAAWRSYAWTAESQHPYASELYSPWQLLYLPDTVDGGRLTVDAADVLDAPDLETLQRTAETRLSWRRELDDQWRPTIKLLVALQPRLWPFRKQRTTLLYTTERGASERVDPLKAAADGFAAEAVLGLFGLDVRGVPRIYLDFARAARRLDPVGSWFELTDAARRRRTDQFTGPMLRARDHYDACFLLRGLYFLATDRWLPDPAETDAAEVWGDWDNVVDRLEPSPQLNQLRRIKSALIREGIYPHRVHFFVEGHTEEIVLKELLPFLGFELESSGMTVTNIGGIDKAERYRVLFDAATEYAARTVFVGDREGDIESVLQRLRADGHFSEPEDVLLWETPDGQPSSFEEVNLTRDELLSAIETDGRRFDQNVSLNITAAELDEEFDQAIARAAAKRRPRPGLANVALKLARDRALIRADKKPMAPLFAEALKRAIRDAGDLHTAGTYRPFLHHLWIWLVASR